MTLKISTALAIVLFGQFNFFIYKQESLAHELKEAKDHKKSVSSLLQKQNFSRFKDFKMPKRKQSVAIILYEFISDKELPKFFLNSEIFKEFDFNSERLVLLGCRMAC